MGIKVGDLVLAYHGVLIYDAKVLKVDTGHGVQEEARQGVHITASTQFYVHYQGWAKKWDEWVRYDRVLEATTANRLLQQRAKEELAEAKQKKKRVDRKRTSSRSRAGADAAAAGRQSPFKRLKRNVEKEVEEMPDEEAATLGGSSKQVSLQMPFSLKKQLVEDWKRVTQAPHQLVPLPRKPNVQQIITTYLDVKQSKVRAGEASEEKEFKNVTGVMEGVQSYFDRAMSSLLLYRIERRQYQELRQKQTENVPLSQIYGAEHLIRLFVRLPVLLASSSASPRELVQIQARLNDFLKFLQKNSAAWFLTEYEAMSDKYVELALATQ
uniref:Chromo domain-containing protein n=1 Tax=Peronospora matthiolae TaxID=2874970 RepID=A0AAV1T5R9_9STRA